MTQNTRRRTRKKALGPRVPPEARKSQLIAVAAQLLTDHGEDRVQITDVAQLAGVSRPLVYRMFPTRQALVRAVLEDFAQFLNQRFQRTLSKHGPQDLPQLVSGYVDACCEAISVKGSGPWLLLDPRGADLLMAEVGREIFLELLNPWQNQLGAFLGVSNRRASHVLWIIVTAGRAALGGWIEGIVSRTQAVKDSTAVVIALLRVFLSEQRPPLAGTRT